MNTCQYLTTFTGNSFNFSHRHLHFGEREVGRPPEQQQHRGGSGKSSAGGVFSGRSQEGALKRMLECLVESVRPFGRS